MDHCVGPCMTAIPPPSFEEIIHGSVYHANLPHDGVRRTRTIPGSTAFARSNYETRAILFPLEISGTFLVIMKVYQGCASSCSHRGTRRRLCCVEAIVRYAGGNVIRAGRRGSGASGSQSA